MELLKVKHISLSHIDKDTSSINYNLISISNAQNYIINLTQDMIENKIIREYAPKTNTNFVINNILEIVKSILLTPSKSEIASTITFRSDELIAEKLLEVQQIAQEKYKHLTKIKKGSLIQSLIENETGYIYVLALIDHSSFLDIKDLTEKNGLPESKKATFKTARIEFNLDLSVHKIYLSDSSPSISEYWYDGFLELKECKSDMYNTKKAYNCIKSMLSEGLGKTNKQDLLEYTNALNVYFSSSKSFVIDECLDFIFSIEPINDTLDREDIKLKIKSKNDSYNLFDNTFSVDITDIKKQLKNIKFTLNSNIELKIKNNLDKVKESVFATKLIDGETVLAIKNVDIKELEKFNFNKIKLD